VQYQATRFHLVCHLHSIADLCFVDFDEGSAATIPTHPPFVHLYVNIVTVITIIVIVQNNIIE